jgi:CBS domain-containing protein/gamma-glutamylcysteine synthetase
MGQHDAKKLSKDQASMRQFTRQIIKDMQALEYMLREGMFETGIRRIGAEQELFLINKSWQPASIVEEVQRLNTDERVVTELAKFNLEYNLTPYVFGGDCLRQTEHQLTELLAYVRSLVEQTGNEVVLTGILPTIHLSDLGLENLTPKPRYFALDDSLKRLRGSEFQQYQIRGVDELFFQHNTVLVEACNTSFQTHFQVDPEEFAHFYNIAQLVAAPVLAAATNSPVLFGKRLWRETRIALFQQAVDTRSSNLYLREMSPRVHFGTTWVKKSVTEIYKEDIARFRVIMTTDYEDPFEVLKRGEIPKLRALQLHNGTVYRWNRACYGIMDGKPHLRIENRVLPAGPTLVDEVANAAFWFGLVSGIGGRYADIAPLMEFDDAKSNLVAAARLGLDAQLVWLEGRRVPAQELIVDELLPMAREGLSRSGIDASDIDRYLGIIEERVRSGQTGSQWMLDSLARLKRMETSRAERLDAVVASMVHHQKAGQPVHTWPLADIESGPIVKRMPGTRVEHYMTTELFTVHEEELIEFVACLMDWRRIHHVVVEDNQHKLVGLVTHRHLLRYMGEVAAMNEPDRDVPVKDIMIRNPITVTPETPTMEAVRLLREHRVSALPVVRDREHDRELVGIITENDFMRIASQLLDETLHLDARS